MRANTETHNWTACKTRDFGALCPKWDVLITSLPSVFKELFGGENGKNEPEVLDDSKEYCPSTRNNSIVVYMSSQRMWQQEHGLYRFKPD